MFLKKIILTVFILNLNLVFAQDFFQNHLLIALQKEAAPLATGKIKNFSQINNSKLAQILSKHHAVRIERWLKSADQNDVYEGIDFSKVYRIYFEKSSVLNMAMTDLKTVPEIQQVSYEAIPKIAIPIPAATTSDPYLERQYYLDKILAKYVWTLIPNVEAPDKEILIGIVDTGIDYLHPEMEPVLYINPGEDIDGDGRFTDADLNGLDDDGNGFVDDVRGWDFSYASDSTAGDNDIRPPNAGGYEILSHGTHVAGIAGAMSNNGLGISGIARGYKIIGTKHSLDDDLSHGYLYNAYDGILYCAKLGADVVNCSWGGPGYYDLAQKLIDMVRNEYGTIVVAAAGNDNTNNDIHHFYPSDLDGVVTVAALGPDGRKASFSNYGQVIDISAPGVGIFSTIHYYKGGYASWQGTSMASPVVAGSIALVKYFFTDLSPDELVQKVLEAAEPLDDRNPAYRGLLGSGEVNVFNAVGPTFLPNVATLKDSLHFDDLNQNGQIDPGEKIYMGLLIENKAGWQPVQDVQVTASTQDSLIYFQDSLAFIGDLASGAQVWTGINDFEFIPDKQHFYGPFNIHFTIRGRTVEGQTIEEYFDKQIVLSMYQKPFPVTLNPGVLPVSIVRDSVNGTKKLALITVDNQLALLDDKGQLLEPFPVDLGEFHRVPMVVLDVDQDGCQEIATLSNYGKLRIFKQDGERLLDIDLKEVVYGNFAADDLNGDGQPEFVIVTMRKKLHLLSVDGTEFDGFPVNLAAFTPEGVAIGDLNQDGFKEIVVGTFDGKLHVIDYQGNELPNWPVELPAAVKFTPVVGKDKNGLFIGIIDKLNDLILFSPDGQQKLMVHLRKKVNYEPFLMDWDHDGVLEFSFIDENNYLMGYGSDNRRISVKLAQTVNSAPLIFSSQGQWRLVVSDFNGKITVFNDQFIAQPYAPIDLSRSVFKYPSLTDLDNDGDMEVIVTGNDRLTVLDLPDQWDQQAAWSTYLANERRTSYFEVDSATTTNINDHAFVPVKLTVVAFPNPFNSTVRLKIALPAQYKQEEISVKIFDLRGRLVKTIKQGLSHQSHLNLFWNGLNEQNLMVSTGIYFLQVKLGGKTQILKKLAFIK